MSSNPIQKRSRIRDTLPWFVRGSVIAGILLLFAVVISGPWIVEIPLHVAFGWVLHGKNSVPPLLDEWKSWLLPLGCLSMATVLIHRFSNRWLIANGSDRRLRPIQTIAAIALVLSGSAAAIALSGIVHQTYWLMGDRWLERSGKADITYVVNQARQLMMVLEEYHVENGRYPESLQDLEAEGFPAELGWIRYGTGKVPESFMFLHPASARVLNGEEPVIVSQVLQRDGKFVVGYADTSVRSLPASQFNKVLSQRVNQHTKPANPDE